MKISHRTGMVSIIVLAVGATLADSMFKLLSILYDGFFAAAIIYVVLNKAPKGETDKERT
jgi:hypothetical protein